VPLNGLARETAARLNYADSWRTYQHQPPCPRYRLSELARARQDGAPEAGVV